VTPRLDSPLRFGPAAVDVDRRPDGSLVLRSPRVLGAHDRAVGDWLVRWAREAPDRTFLAERSGEGWRELGYAAALDAVRRVGQSLLRRGLGPARPVLILSDNSIDHALLALGAMHVGVPAVPVSPAYSLVSRDFAKLRTIAALVRPGLVFAADPERFASALRAIGMRSTPFEELLAAEAGPEVDDAFAALGPDTVAKILFTSGSTGIPKGVVNTQRMLTVNQQQMAEGWPFLEDRPPRLVDWLPWNHTFGANHNFNLVLRNGGTLYLDAGKPAPGLADVTARNLREVSPTLYFNVPRGFEFLLADLEKDAALRRSFFRELDVVFYAGAVLPQNLWDRMARLAAEEKGGRLAMLSAWGATETGPLATQVHFAIDRPGVIGLPVPGCELKLVPSAGKLEVRVRGPNVSPGYYRSPETTAAAFDEEGFYRTGDAVKLCDPEEPRRGLVFDGRVAEDFKLSSGTWVHVGALRVRLIAACDPLVQDAVITGHDRGEIGALVFLNPSAAGSLSAGVARERLAAGLRALAAETAGSSLCPRCLLVLRDPPSIDANEITDKGYLNQRAVLEARAARVDELYAGGPDVIRLEA
jgi:feruloyl-CoA synthase